jgi:hypothetical protein
MITDVLMDAKSCMFDCQRWRENASAGRSKKCISVPQSREMILCGRTFALTGCRQRLTRLREAAPDMS